MLALNPSTVTFNLRTFADVSLIALDRAAEKLIEEWSDAGPHTTFVDVAEQRTTIRIVQSISLGDLAGSQPTDPPALGESGNLVFFTAPSATSANRRMVTIPAVVTSVRHDLGAKPATRTVTLVAVSSAGGVDPVVVDDA